VRFLLRHGVETETRDLSTSWHVASYIGTGISASEVTTYSGIEILLLYGVHLFVRLSVCLSPKCKNAIFSKSKQFRAMLSIDDL